MDDNFYTSKTTSETFQELVEGKGYTIESSDSKKVEKKPDKGNFPQLLDKLNEISGSDKWDRVETNIFDLPNNRYEPVYVNAIKKRKNGDDYISEFLKFFISQLPGFCAVSMIHIIKSEAFQFDGIKFEEYNEALDLVFDALEDKLKEIKEDVERPGSGIGDGPGNLGVYISHKAEHFLIKYLENRESWELDLEGNNPKTGRHVKMLRYLIH